MKHSNKPTPFFSDLETWKKEWKGMPEFIQEDLSPFQSIIVHFEKKEDVEKFSKLVGQRLTKKTKNIWYPKAEILIAANKRYVDES
jgi:hypothetical protein